MASPDRAGRRGWIAPPSAVGLLACALVLVPAFAGAAQTPGVGQERSIQPAPCRAGNALLALGRLKAAEAAYEGALGAGATVRCAREGLAKIGHEHPCAAAKALSRSGEKVEANKVFLESLAAKPAKKCAAAGVKDSAAPSIWEKLKTTTEDATTAIGFVALALAGLAVLGLLLLNLQARIPRLKDLPPVAAIRRPALSIQLLGDSGLTESKLGSATTALLKEKIEPGSGPHGLKVSGEDSTEESWIKRVGEISEQAKVGAAVISLLAMMLPRRRIKLSGEIQPKGKVSGPGISIELDRKLVSERSVTLWAKDFSLPVDGEDDVDTVRRLATPAAAWVSHTATDKTGGQPVVAGKAMSWARFRAGFEWQQEGKREMARKLYESAAAMDGRNYAARLNLGLLRAGDGEHPEAVKLIEEALGIIEDG